MNLNCANCNTEIKSENINISTDLAKCEKCGSIHKVSDLTKSLKKKDFTPPNGSKIIMEKGMDGKIEMTYPSKGFSLSLVPQILFAIFWLGFISFWTWGASQGSIIFAMFSIPFWLVGLSMIAGIINSANEIQTIFLDRHKLIIKRQRPIRPKIFETDLKDIQSIKMKEMKMNPFTMFGNFSSMIKMQRSFGSPVELPAVVTGRKTEYFFDDANDAEQEWVTSILSSLVKRMKR
ncbi:MAG: hypothetical protein AB8B72_05170 [Crocinitomicaceae bacterium]